MDIVDLEKSWLGMPPKKFENSKFSRLIAGSLIGNYPELIADLYTLLSAEIINENLEINYVDSPEGIEKAARILAAVEILTSLLGRNLIVNNCPEEKKSDIEWMIKLFFYLESDTTIWDVDERDVVYEPSEDQLRVFSDNRIQFDLDISGMRFLIPMLEVRFQDK